MKILIILPTFNLGGAERVNVNLINGLNKCGHEVVILSKIAKGPLLKDIPQNVKIIEFGSPFKLYMLLKLLHFVRKEKANVLLSNLSFNLWVCCFRSLIPSALSVFARESNLPSEKIKRYKYPTITRWLYGKYKNFDKVICQSPEMAKDFETIHPSLLCKLVVVPNPVDVEGIQRSLQNNFTEIPNRNEAIQLLMVGRLNKQKRVDVALDVLSELPDCYFLNIAGKDRLNGYLQEYAKSLGLQERVRFLGQVSNPYKLMQRSDCLLLTSDFEGFPNVMLEALACGTQVAALNGIPGVSSVIVNNFNGYVANSTQVLLSYLSNLKKQNEEQKQLVVQDVKARFSSDSIVAKYMAVFEGV